MSRSYCAFTSHSSDATEPEAAFHVLSNGRYSSCSNEALVRPCGDIMQRRGPTQRQRRIAAEDESGLHIR